MIRNNSSDSSSSSSNGSTPVGGVMEPRYQDIGALSPEAIAIWQKTRQAVVSQSVVGAEDCPGRDFRPFNGLLPVQRWRIVSNIDLIISRIRRVAVDAEVYSGKKVIALSKLLVMDVVEIVMQCQGSWLLVVEPGIGELLYQGAVGKALGLDRPRVKIVVLKSSLATSREIVPIHSLEQIYKIWNHGGVDETAYCALEAVRDDASKIRAAKQCNYFKH